MIKVLTIYNTYFIVKRKTTFHILSLGGDKLICITIFKQLIVLINSYLKMYEFLTLPVWVGWAAWLIYKNKFEKKLLNKFI